MAWRLSTWRMSLEKQLRMIAPYYPHHRPSVALIEVSSALVAPQIATLSDFVSRHKFDLGPVGILTELTARYLWLPTNGPIGNLDTLLNGVDVIIQIGEVESIYQSQLQQLSNAMLWCSYLHGSPRSHPTEPVMRLSGKAWTRKGNSKREISFPWSFGGRSRTEVLRIEARPTSTAVVVTPVLALKDVIATLRVEVAASDAVTRLAQIAGCRLVICMSNDENVTDSAFADAAGQGVPMISMSGRSWSLREMTASSLADVEALAFALEKDEVFRRDVLEAQSAIHDFVMFKGPLAELSSAWVRKTSSKLATVEHV